jgi:hypothetical protein
MKGRDSRRTSRGTIASAFEFVETESFADDWKMLGYDDEDLILLQDQILAWPKAAPVIAGTGGLRKLRFVSRRERAGKRGASRVGYVYFEQQGIVVLAAAFAKNVRRDLLPWEKRILKRGIEVWDREFSRRESRRLQ